MAGFCGGCLVVSDNKCSASGTLYTLSAMWGTKKEALDVVLDKDECLRRVCALEEEGSLRGADQMEKHYDYAAWRVEERLTAVSRFRKR